MGVDTIAKSRDSFPFETDENNLHILNQLKVPTLSRAREVCKQWNNLIIALWDTPTNRKFVAKVFTNRHIEVSLETLKKTFEQRVYPEKVQGNLKDKINSDENPVLRLIVKNMKEQLIPHASSSFTLQELLSLSRAQHSDVPKQYLSIIGEMGAIQISIDAETSKIGNSAESDSEDDCISDGPEDGKVDESSSEVLDVKGPEFPLAKELVDQLFSTLREKQEEAFAKMGLDVDPAFAKQLKLRQGKVAERLIQLLAAKYNTGELKALCEFQKSHECALYMKFAESAAKTVSDSLEEYKASVNASVMDEEA